jgi:hypothetical protein
MVAMADNSAPTEKLKEATVDNVKIEVADHSVPSGKVKQVAVENVELADALLKDGYSWTSPSALKLYPIILLITLSMYMAFIFGINANFIKTKP